MADEIRLSVRITAEDKAALDFLADGIPAVNKAQVARACLRLGILALAQDKARVLVGPPRLEDQPQAKPRKAAKRGRGRPPVR